MSYLSLLCIAVSYLTLCLAVTRVIVPSVHKEWEQGKPDWTTEEAQQKGNYSVFLYQKLNASAPNYIATNRGTEGGVYLRYIVDHYDNFPDIAVFVHADPGHHSPNWLNHISCIRPNATWFNINDPVHVCRDPSTWSFVNSDHVLVMEQCWRDVLSVVYGNETNSMLSSNPKLEVCLNCCQQFIMSRSLVLARSLDVWKQLYNMIGVSNVCHSGQIDVSKLHFNRAYSPRLDESTVLLGRAHNGHGEYFQGLTMEHLAHIIFGQQPMKLSEANVRDVCSQYLDVNQCPGSPCNESQVNNPPIPRVEESHPVHPHQLHVHHTRSPAAALTRSSIDRVKNARDSIDSASANLTVEGASQTTTSTRTGHIGHAIHSGPISSRHSPANSHAVRYPSVNITQRKIYKPTMVHKNNYAAPAAQSTLSPASSISSVSTVTSSPVYSVASQYSSSNSVNQPSLRSSHSPPILSSTSTSSSTAKSAAAVSAAYQHNRQYLHKAVSVDTTTTSSAVDRKSGFTSVARTSTLSNSGEKPTAATKYRHEASQQRQQVPIENAHLRGVNNKPV